MYEFAGRLNREDLFIKEFDNWILMVKPVQITLGSCIILLKKQRSSVADILDDEMAEFPKVCKWFEERCRNIYGAVKFNYHANMMKENFVHFHAIPRYDKIVSRHGVEWIDHDWPLADKITKTRVDEDVLLKIRNDFLLEDK